MQAKASVTMVELSPSRTAYSGHSGVGTVPNACNDTKAAVTSQKPMLCGTTRLRALIVDNLRGAAAIVECSAIGGSPVLTVFLTGSSASTTPVRTPMPVRRQRAQMPFICLADDVVRICCNSGLEGRWPMELRQLRHFLALAEERSITRAARRELIVQSGLSNSIQALERELGTPLYVRGTRPVRLTAAGEALVGPARRTLASAAQAKQAVHHTRDVLIGTLRIGVSLSAQHLVPFASYLGGFTRDHPGIDLRLQYAPGLTMISMVETGELDCLIGPAVSQVPGVRMTRLAREPLHLVCRADHRLAEQAEVSITRQRSAAHRG